MFSLFTGTEIHHPVAKASAPLGLAITGEVTKMQPQQWIIMGHAIGEWASVLACVCSALFIVEWFYKRVYKPFAIRRGWMKGPKGFLESTNHGKLDELPPKQD